MHKLTFSAKGIDLLKQTVVILTVFIFIFVFGFTHSLTQYNIMVFFAVFLTLIGGIWLIAKQSTTTPLKPYILIWLAAYSISVYFSIDPRRSLSQMFLMLVGVFLFLLTYDLVNRGWKVEYFFKAFFLIGITITVFSLYEAGSWYLRWISNNPGYWFPDITYRLGTTNLIPPFLNLTFYIGILYFIRSGNKLNKILLAISMFLSMVVLYLTSSRGGWLGLFFGLVAWGLYIFSTFKTQLIAIFHKLKSNRIVFVVIILFFILAIALGGFILYKQTVHPTHGNFITSRRSLWGPTISTFLEHPLVGQGPFTNGGSILVANSAPPTDVHQHGHSLYLNLLAEMGILGLVAASIFMYFYFRRFRYYFTQSKNKLHLLVIFAFIVSCAMHNIFDSYHTKPAMLWPLAILAGAAIVKPDLAAGQQKNPRPWGVLIIIGIAWVAIWALQPYYQGIDYANQNQWDQAFIKFQEAVKRDPGNALAHQQMGLTAAVLTQEGDKDMLDISIQETLATIKFEPSWALNHANLAVLYIENDQQDLAIQSAQKAVALAPGSGLYALNSGFVLEQAGETEEAKNSYEKALSLSSALTGVDFWNETNFRKETFATWLVDQPHEAEITIEDAQKILSANQHFKWAYNLMASTELRYGDFSSARQSLENAELAFTYSNADILETHWLWAEYYAQTGEMEKAIKIGNETIERYAQYGVYGPGTFGSLQYAPNLFRLSGIALEIVPQMEKMPIPAIWLDRAELLKIWEEQVQ
jgi:tetratricopeptide (TPR) repeat protein